jgi:hypothetical protein
LESTDLRFEQPVISEVTTSSESLLPNSDITVSAKISMADSVFMFYRNARLEQFIELKMYDNGANGDVSAGDGIYSTELNAGTGQLQYYIYAENEKLGRFSPERAAHEYYNLGVAGELVINEFLASNDSTNADESGEYDDWLELYNNSEQEIFLNGYFLSDDEDNLQRWELPDTSIPAGEYLIVWADGDSDQGSLHTNFRLSADGEEIFLTDSEGEIIDHINFGSQIADISNGRFPNGSGPFVPMFPTAGTENENTISEFQEEEIIPEGYYLSQNYPNPFNPVTTIEYSIPQYQGLGLSGFSKDVKLVVYDVLGRQVAILVNEKIFPGNYIVEFNASSLPSGVYFYVLITNEFILTKKMMLLK